jgi:hypothetical protein
MVPSSIRVPVSSELVFPLGAMFHSVGPVIDVETREAGTGDPQERNKQSGMPVWSVNVFGLDPEAGKFGRSAEVKVKIAADYQLVPRAARMPGFPPKVAFTNVTATPYVNSKTGRFAWSVRADDLVAFDAEFATSEVVR